LIKKIPLPIIIAIIIIALFLPGLSKYHDLQEQKRTLERKISDLQKVNAELKSKMDRLQNDPVYLEQVAREKMKKTREGEYIYRTK